MTSQTGGARWRTDLSTGRSKRSFQVSANWTASEVIAEDDTVIALMARRTLIT